MDSSMPSISAQISLYPLRQEHLAPAIEEVLEVLRNCGVGVFPGTMSTLVTGDSERVFCALREGFQKASLRGQVVMVVTLSNGCPAATATAL